MNTLARIVIIGLVIFTALLVGVLAIDGHFAICVACVVPLSISIVYAGDAAAELGIGARAAWITTRHRYARWRRRLAQLAGESTAVSMNPYRDDAVRFSFL